MASLSLLRQRDVWKQKIAQINSTIASTTAICEIGGEELELATKPWRAHWDHQIFKVMEAQYRLGLESLNESLPEIKADLIFHNKTCRLKPSVEDLKANYYREIKNFIQLPTNFRGLEGAPGIYKAMPERNPDIMKSVFVKAEQLFSKITEVGEKQMEKYLVLGQNFDLLQDLIDEFKEVREWEVNFKHIKAKRKEVEKIPDVIKVGMVGEWILCGL